MRCILGANPIQGGSLLHIAVTKPLFAWDRLEDSPKAGNISRFLDVLGQEPQLSELQRVFAVMVEKLGLVVPDLGQHTAGDATALNAPRKADPAALAEEQSAGLPQPSGGRKEYTADAGTVTKVVEWFGYKLHSAPNASAESLTVLASLAGLYCLPVSPVA